MGIITAFLVARVKGSCGWCGGRIGYGGICVGCGRG